MTRQRRHKSAKSSGPPRDPNREHAGRESSHERLQKVLAAAGVASRRDCEELIREGRVEVDRKVVTELGTRVDPVAQEIRVDGETLRRPKRVYYALNKPMDIVCTNHDPSGRTRVIDLVPDDERVFAVGRLDRASEGLILLTNDGEFSNHITHPRYGVEKTYLVRVAGRPGPEQLAKLRRGVHLAEGFCKVESVAIKGRHKQSTDLLMVLDEGRNREIRRVLAKVGHKVIRLKRIAIGDLKLGALEEGQWRKLTQAEIDALLAISRKKRKDKKKQPPREMEASEEKPPREEQAPTVKPKPAAKPTAASPPKPKAPSAKEIADRLLAGKDFEDDDDDFEELLGEDEDGDLEDDELDDGDFGDDEGDDDLTEQTVIREEIRDDRSPPRSGPAPRGEVIEFDEDSPPPLQPRKVREQRSFEKPRPAQADRPVRAEPRTGHRRRGDEQGRGAQGTRRGQRHRQEEAPAPGRAGHPARRPGGYERGPHGERGRLGDRRPGDQREERRPRPEGGFNPRREKDRAAAARGEPRAEKAPLPKRPGKLVADRPQEDRGARGKFPGKSFGKGKKFEGGGRGPKTIFGKRVKKKGRGQR